MDPIETIGHILKKSGDHQRDAIHIAILPVYLDEDWLRPGQTIKFVPDSMDKVRYTTCYSDRGIGIIDPYISILELKFKRGDKVWCFLHPNTVKGMRHHWHHPGVDDRKPVANKSELWLRNFADSYGMNYDEMIAAAQDGDTDGEQYITANAKDLHGAKELEPGEEDLFWSHMEALTNKVYNAEHRKAVCWSCSC